MLKLRAVEYLENQQELKFLVENFGSKNFFGVYNNNLHKIKLLAVVVQCTSDFNYLKSF